MEDFFAAVPGLHILVGLLILLAILCLVSWTARQPPGKIKLYLFQAGIVTAIVALVAMVFTGQLHWLFAVVGGALPVVMRLMPLLQRALASRPIPYSKRRSSASQSRPSSSNSSRRKVETHFLRVSLDEATGDMRGIVRRGSFRDRHLSELSVKQLRQLHEEYSRRDAESAALLAAYLDRTHGDAQESRDGSAEREPQDAGGERAKRRTKPGKGMTREEAYEILGLQNGADAQAVTDAHRRLMQKLHPDRGGSNYLAAKINQAKDLLLER